MIYEPHKLGKQYVYSQKKQIQITPLLLVYSNTP